MAINAHRIVQPHVPGDQTKTFAEKASQAFPAFWPVKLTSGQVETWIASTGTATVDTSSTTLVGIAQRAASGTTNTKIPVKIIRADSELELPLYHSTSASATHSQVTVGASYAGIAINGKLYVDLENTSNGCFKVMSKVDGYSSTEPYAPVRVKVSSTVLSFP